MLGTDLGVQRMLTRAFIETMPVVIALTPRKRVKTSSGGFSLVDQPVRPVQTLRLVEPTSPGLPIRVADGVQRETAFVLLGAHDSAFDVHDVFTYDGVKWEITLLYPDNGWERRATVARYAK